MFVEGINYSSSITLSQRNWLLFTVVWESHACIYYALYDLIHNESLHTANYAWPVMLNMGQPINMIDGRHLLIKMW